MALNLSALLGGKKQIDTSALLGIPKALQPFQDDQLDQFGLPKATIGRPTGAFPEIKPAETIRRQQEAVEKLNLTALVQKAQVRFPFAVEKSTPISPADPITRLAFRLPELPGLIVTNAVNFLKKNIEPIIKGEDITVKPIRNILGVDTKRFGADVDEELRFTISEAFRQALEEERLNPSGGDKIKATTNALKAVSKTVVPDVLDALFAVDISKGLLRTAVGAARISARQLPESLLFRIQKENVSPQAIYDVLIGGEAKAGANEARIAREFINTLPANERGELFRIARSYEATGLRVPITGKPSPTALGRFARAEAPKEAFPPRITGLLPGGVRPATAGFLDVQAMGEEFVSLARKAKDIKEFQGLLSKEQAALLAARGFTAEVFFSGVKERTAKLDKIFNEKAISPEPLAQSISKAKASGQSFDEWVKGQGEVFHGSPDKTFYKKGEMFFAGSEEDAIGYAQQFSEAGKFNVLKGYFSPQRPLDMRVEKIGVQKLNELYKSIGIKNVDIERGVKHEMTINFRDRVDAEKMSSAVNQIRNQDEIIKYAKLKGYDAILLDDMTSKANLPIDTSLALKPEVLKTRSELKAKWDRVTEAPPPDTIHQLPHKELEAEISKETFQRAKQEAKSVEYTPEKGVVQTSESLPNITTKEGIAQANVKDANIPPSKSSKTTENDWRGTFELPPETKLQALRRSVEDFNVRLKVLNDKIEESAGERIGENFNLWAQKDMLPRQQSDILRRIREEKQDFVRRLVEADVKVRELDDYLHARHAIERNAKMNELRKEKGLEPKDGLSGMTDARAKEILLKDNKKFEPFEKEIRAKTKAVLDFEVSEGLLKSEEAEIIRKAYENYVPLYRDVGEDMLGIGQGIDIRGKEIKRAKGSEKRVISPLGNVFFQEERAQVRALKNKIGNTILDLVEEYPFVKDLFKIEKQQYVPRFNAEGELQFLDPKFKFADNVLGTKRNGTQYFITVQDAKTARALKNVNIARIPAAVQFLRSGLAIWSSFKTRWRPEFLITNFQRDLGEALVNLGVEKTFLAEQGKGLRIAVVKNLFSSQRQIWKYLRGKQDAQADEFFRLGGDAGHFWLESVNQAETSLLELEKQIQNIGIEKLKNPVRQAGQLVDDINSMVELGIRYSTYKELVKRGMSKQKAIQAVADLTLNFSRQGELSPVLKSAYGFINPAIQGTSKVIRTIGTEQGRARILRALSYLVALGFLTRTISMMIDDDGDEQISDWAKNHKLTFAVGGGKSVTLWSMPYGYTTFYSFGSNMAEVAFGKKTFGEATSNIFDTSINAFSPFGTSLNDITPTLVKPLFDINANKGWYGGKIHPEQAFTNTPKPNTETYFKNVAEPAKFIAEWMNKLTGGGDGKSGLIDLRPNDLEYMYDQMFGGPFEFITSSIESGARGTQGEFDPNKTPFVRQFYRENTVQQWSYGVIYDTLERAYKKDLSDLEVERFYRAVETGLSEEIFSKERADSFIRDFIKAQYKISGTMTSDETLEQLKSLPEGELEKLISTYAASTQKTIRNKLGASVPSGKKSLQDIFGAPSQKKTLEEIFR